MNLQKFNLFAKQTWITSVKDIMDDDLKRKSLNIY